MWAPFLEALAIPISLILAGGGAKNLIDLIKMWVEAKNGRTVKLKRGDIEIEIRGDVPRSEVVRAEKLLRHLEKARESKTKRANSQSGPAGKK